MIPHGMTIPRGEPQALGLPEASKCVGTTSGACLTNQIKNKEGNLEDGSLFRSVYFYIFFHLSLSFFFFVGVLPFFLRQTISFAQSLGDDPLQLAVGAAELVSCPCLYSVHRLSVNAQDKTLCILICHILVIQCSSVHNWLSTVITAEHNKQIADHCSFLVVIKIYDIVIR